MHWYFRGISDDPSEKELTQQDQFNNDEVALAEAIVRETVQNSTDAQAGSNSTVRVRFAINTINGSDRAFFEEIVAGLSPHLRACDMAATDSANISSARRPLMRSAFVSKAKCKQGPIGPMPTR